MNIVIFGITGHLAETKLLPAIKEIKYEKGSLPQEPFFGIS